MKQPFVKLGYTVVLLLLLFLTILSFRYFLYWSPKAQKSWANVTNTLGMNAKQVVDIMATPGQINKLDCNSGKFEYYYAPPFSASDGIYIVMDKDSLVNGIVSYE